MTLKEVSVMVSEKREIRRKLRILKHAETAGQVSRTYRYCGIGGATFYRWRKAYRERGQAGLTESGLAGSSN